VVAALLLSQRSLPSCGACYQRIMTDASPTDLTSSPRCSGLAGSTPCAATKRRVPAR